MTSAVSHNTASATCSVVKTDFLKQFEMKTADCRSVQHRFGYLKCRKNGVSQTVQCEKRLLLRQTQLQQLSFVKETHQDLFRRYNIQKKKKRSLYTQKELINNPLL